MSPGGRYSRPCGSAVGGRGRFLDDRACARELSRGDADCSKLAKSPFGVLSVIKGPAGPMCQPRARGLRPSAACSRCKNRSGPWARKLGHESPSSPRPRSCLRPRCCSRRKQALILSLAALGSAPAISSRPTASPAKARSSTRPIPQMMDPSSSNAWVSWVARVPTSTEPRTLRCGTRQACRSIRSGLRNAGLGNTSGLHRPWFGRAKPAWPASRPSRGRPHSRLPKM